MKIQNNEEQKKHLFYDSIDFYNRIPMALLRGYRIPNLWNIKIRIEKIGTQKMIIVVYKYNN